jgi:hypothetical protein
MCLDHPDRVMKVSLLDVVPTYHVWTHTTKNWAIGSRHWAFMAQPPPFPERLLSAACRVLLEEPDGDPQRHRPRLPHRDSAR